MMRGRYPVVEIIDRDRLLQALELSVVRARMARDEWRDERAANCRCWDEGAVCEWCEVNC